MAKSTPNSSFFDRSLTGSQMEYLSDVEMGEDAHRFTADKMTASTPNNSSFDRSLTRSKMEYLSYIEMGEEADRIYKQIRLVYSLHFLV